MLDTSLMSPTTHRIVGTLEFVDKFECVSGTRLRFRHSAGELVAWSWLPLPKPGALGMFKGTAVILPIKRQEAENLLVSFERDDFSPITPMFSEELCPIPGVVRQITQLVDQMKTAPLRRFVSDALLQPVARKKFWRLPASWMHHHAYGGGLAQHSLEIAKMVASAEGVSDEDRDLGIALAILHDYGKLEYTAPKGDGLSPNHHEQTGRKLLAPLLDQLLEESYGVGIKMRELLGGPRTPRTSPYPLAIGRVVHAFDQLSCEANKRMMEEMLS